MWLAVVSNWLSGWVDILPIAYPIFFSSYKSVVFSLMVNDDEFARPPPALVVSK